jgi:general secretion pathway protein E
MFGFLKKQTEDDAPIVTRTSTSSIRLKAVTPRVDVEVSTQNGVPPTLVGVKSGIKTTITTLELFPTYLLVKTGFNASYGVFKLHEEVRNHLMVIELSTNKYAVVYDPDFQKLVRPYLAGLRQGVLGSNAFAAFEEDIFASSEVIEKVYLNEVSRNKDFSGDSDTSDGAKLFKEWASIAASTKGVTDLHLNCRENGRGIVRMRVHGRLRPINRRNGGIYTNNEIMSAVVAAFNMAESGSNVGGTFDENGLHSCVIGKKLGIPNIKLRFATMGGNYGVAAVSRILHTDPNMSAMPFHEMGLLPTHIALLKKAQKLSSGMIVIAGKTGSGKTTLQKTLVESNKAANEMAIYGLYDPIEYPVRYTHQKSIQREISDSADAKSGKITPYQAHTNHLMRMDLDLADGGEIRDNITGLALMTIASTDHLAMGTLHAKFISGIVPRLISPAIGLNRDDLTDDNILGFLAFLSLASKLCKHCALPVDEKIAELNEAGKIQEFQELKVTIAKLKETFNMDVSSLRFINETGCEHCDSYGTSGLIMLAEMMLPDSEWCEFVKNKQTRQAEMHWRKKYSDRNPLSSNMEGKKIIENAAHCANLGLIDARTVEEYGLLEHYVKVED